MERGIQYTKNWDTAGTVVAEKVNGNLFSFHFGVEPQAKH